VSGQYVDLELLTRSASGHWHRLADDGRRLDCTRDQPRDTDRRKTLREVDAADLCPLCFADLCWCREHMTDQPCQHWCSLHGVRWCDEHPDGGDEATTAKPDEAS
jgi:hypothetical protein